MIMCMFVGPVEDVSKTKIYAGDLGENKRLLVYQMNVKSSDDNAMVLPVPLVKGSEFKFVNFEKLPNFFDDLEKMFVPLNKSKGLGGGMLRCSFGSKIEVEQVGSFEASFVPSVNDFSRLDERFRLDSEVLAKLPYEDYGFAVFKLRSGNQKVHPMAFTYTSVDSSIFIPTLHIHNGGSVSKKDDYDHALYVSKEKGIGGWQTSRFSNIVEHVFPYKQAEELEEHFLSDSTISKHSLKGYLTNGDVFITDVKFNHVCFKGQMNPYETGKEEIKKEITYLKGMKKYCDEKGSHFGLQKELDELIEKLKPSKKRKIHNIITRVCERYPDAYDDLDEALFLVDSLQEK